MQITQKITALLDAPHQWQTGFQDPASGSMEEILVFNKHLTFFLVFIVLFVGWFLACTVYYFVELNNLYYNKFEHSKEFKDVWCFVSSPLFFFLVFSVIVNLNGNMSVALLEEVSLSLEELPSSESAGPGSTPNPLQNANLDMMDKSVLAEIEQIMLYFKKEGYTTRQIFNTLNRFPSSFWSLGYWEKIAEIEASLHTQNEDDVRRQGLQIIAFSAVILLLVTLLARFAGV